MSRHPAVSLLLSLLSPLLVACASDEPVGPGPLASIVIAPPPPEIEVGDGTALTATVLDRDGTVLGGYSVIWTSTDTAVATVSSAGLVSARGVGSATIRATSQGTTGAVAVVVRPAAVARVDIAGGDLAIIVGHERQVMATAFDGHGTPLDRPVVWTSADSAVLTVGSAGQVVARSRGTTTLIATSAGRSDTVAVTVSGQLWGMTDAGGAALPGAAYTTTVIRDGVARTAQFHVTRGVIGLTGDRYTMRLHGSLLIDGAPPEPTTLSADGALAYDVSATGDPLFFEGNDWVNRVPRFRGRFRPDGSLEIAYSRDSGGAVVPLGFRQ